MKKMDEMELAISLRAIRWAYLFTVLALFGWGMWDYIRQGVITMPFHLLILQNLVYFFATQIAKINAGDEGAKKSIIQFALMTAALIGFGALLFFFAEQ